MTNRSRDKGTMGETAVVNWFHDQGERQVERHSLKGAADVGDINGLPSMVVSVKRPGKGKPIDLSGWLNRLEQMRHNANRYEDQELPCGLLIVRRVGYPDVGRWYAVMELAQWWSMYSEVLV